MPSLPTSLIVVGLVVAWLVVLVPMVARRREHVPESDEGTRGFRVLRRASRSLRRRRPVLSRTAVTARATDRFEGEDVDAQDVDGESGEFDELAAGADGPAEVSGGRADASDGGDEASATYPDDGDAADGGFDGGSDRGLDAAYDGDEAAGPPAYPDRRPPGRVSAGRSARRAPSSERPGRAPMEDYEYAGQDRPRGAGTDRHRQEFHDAADEWAAEHQYRSGAADAQVPRRDHTAQEDWHDAERFRPVPVRQGRGGFDPRLAEQAKRYRYRQRRRVVLVLLALVVLGVVFGVLGVTLGWAGAVVATVLLACYLAYLRRQVRIEESIRLRRAARLDRARQIRPAYRASVAEQVRAHRTGSLHAPDVADAADAPYRVSSHARPAASVPPVYYGPGVPVDLDDDDPAFDDLEYYRAVTYRRAAGE